MKVVLDRTKCIGCGTCAALCPKYFEMAADNLSKLKSGVTGTQKNLEELTISEIECIKDAADSCPGQAIKIV